MDSEEVAAILKQAGVGDDIVGKVYTDLKLPAPGTSAETPAKSQTAYAQVKDSISKLNTKQRKQLMSMLQKQLGTT